MAEANSHEWPDQWFVRQPTCLWCGGNALEPLLDGVRDWYFAAVPGEFAFLRCAACQSLVLDRRPDDAHIGAAYDGYYTRAQSPDARGRSVLKRAARIVKRAYASRRHGADGSALDRVLSWAFLLLPGRRLQEDIFNRFLPDRASRVLDYGCGNGDFLERAEALGHQVWGVDFDPEAIDVARKRGFPVVLAGEGEDKLPEDKFDLITANHVIEHVADPRALLRAFRKRLAPGGRLFIEVPNAQARGLLRNGRFWRGLEAPRHFSLPSQQALAAALVHAGFDTPRFCDRAFAERSGGLDRMADDVRVAHPQVETGPPLSGEFASDEFITALAVAS